MCILKIQILYNIVINFYHYIDKNLDVDLINFIFFSNDFNKMNLINSF